LLWAINLGCAQAVAFPYLELVGSPDGTQPCGGDEDTIEHPITCAPVDGFTCRLWPPTGPDLGSFLARCREDADPFVGLEVVFR
jgi:hypothetical protein